MAQCSWCLAKEKPHSHYRECPLFQDNMVCEICCDEALNYKNEDGTLEVIDIILEATGKTMTNQEVIAICHKCGKNDY